MRYLSLAALKVALADLFANRHGPLVLSSAGKTYEPILLTKKSLVDALPEAFTGGKPLAEILTDTDLNHDGFGAAIWHLTEAYQRWPNVSADVRAAVSRVRAAFIPELNDLQASYVVEVNAAIKHKADLTTLEADLKMIPIAGNLSLYDWCVGFVAGAEKIGVLLGQRADINSNTRGEAGKLRSSIVGILGRFRAALADEVANDPNLPRDLDAKLFGYFDELADMRASALAAQGKKPATTPPPPGTP